MAPETDPYAEAYTAALAAELRAARARLQMSFPEIATATGIPRNTLLRYFNGQRDIPVPTFGRIARALNLSPGDLLDAVQTQLAEQF
jgi:transcriptional regulator with XRE-family HTH domain